MNLKATPIYVRARGGPVSPRSIGYTYQNGATLGGAVIRPQPILTFGQGASPSPGGHLTGVATGSLWGAGSTPYSNNNVYAGNGFALQNPGRSTVSGNRPTPILTHARNGLFS